MKVAAEDLPGILGGTLREVTALLGELGVPYALIGGLAVGVHTHARATKDIDLAVRAEPEAARRVVDAMASRGFAPRAHGNVGPGGVVRFSRTDLDGITRWIDLLFAGTPFEERAVVRATRMPALGGELPVVSVEDLLVYKLIAGRPQDVADAVRLLADHRDRLDRAYLETALAEWELGAELERVERLVEGG